MPVFATDIEQLEKDVDDMANRIEQTTNAYQEAVQRVEELEDGIAKNETREKELQDKLPAQRARAAASVKEMYLFQQSSNSLLSIILNSDTFEDFLTTMTYLDAIHQHNVTEITSLINMVGELDKTRASLVVQHDEAIQKQEEAQAALDEAREVRAELQARAVSVALTEQGDRAAAIAVAQKALEASSNDATFTTASGNTASVEVPANASVSTEELVNNITSSESSDWASRIDTYLKGSPLEGYGKTFADAAAKYGVDPRLSPAIATIESGKGSVCFRDHNAWGWGDSDYADWETAIYEQVQGLATGYDGTLTLEGAERYCPPNYQEWYSSVASEMDGI
jgi:peptidoglycan hydrolase CwlO-like protein